MSIDLKGQSRGARHIDDFIDRYFYTPFGAFLTWCFQRTPVTPNQISILSVVVALGAAIAFFYRSLPGAIAGSLLLIFSGVLDSVDGQLARATGRTSKLGGTLDGICDTLSFILVYLAAIASFVVFAKGSLLQITLIAMVSGFCHSLQSALVDFERQLYIYFTTGRGRISEESIEQLKRELGQARAQGASWLTRIMMRMHLTYCRRQQRWLRSSVKLLALVQGLPPEERLRHASLYQERSRYLIRFWNIMGTNSHTLGFIVSAFVPFLFPGTAAAQYGIALAFFYNIALSVPLAVLILAQRQVDRAIIRAMQRAS